MICDIPMFGNQAGRRLQYPAVQTPEHVIMPLQNELIPGIYMSCVYIYVCACVSVTKQRVLYVNLF